MLQKFMNDSKKAHRKKDLDTCQSTCSSMNMCRFQHTPPFTLEYGPYNCYLISRDNILFQLSQLQSSSLIKVMFLINYYLD